MKINAQALCKAFLREWEVDTLPADFPDELNIIIKMVDYWLSSTEDYSKMSIGEKEILTENEANLIFLNKHDENQIQILDEAREKLQSIMENLYDEDVPQEEIKKLFTQFTEEL